MLSAPNAMGRLLAGKASAGLASGWVASWTRVPTNWPRAPHPSRAPQVLLSATSSHASPTRPSSSGRKASRQRPAADQAPHPKEHHRPNQPPGRHDRSDSTLAASPTPRREANGKSQGRTSSSSNPRDRRSPTARSPGAASASQQGYASVDATAGVPQATFVPRDPAVQDGPWSRVDQQQVKAAQTDAAEAVGPATVDAAGVVLLGKTLEELQELAVQLKQQPFRAKQLLTGLINGAKSVEDFRVIPHEFRRDLMGLGVRTGRSIIHGRATSPDGTQKLLLQLAEGRVVETVGIPSGQRLTVCVSSQVGCPMRCTFCATGKGGFARNLQVHEIVDQVLTIQEVYGRRVSNIVFMGMGEPLLNLPVVCRAVRYLQTYLGISGRAITISTVGVPNAIRKLADERLTATLAVSIHAPNQQLRESIIPSAKAYPLEALMDDCGAYFSRTRRRVTFEYTLMSGVNDREEHAEELAVLLRRHSLMSHVNLIPWNPVDESEYKRPALGQVQRFKEVLEGRGLPCSVRSTRGLEAAAACGQLRNRFQKQALEEPAALT